MYGFQVRNLLEQLARIADALEEANEINREIMRNH